MKRLSIVALLLLTVYALCGFSVLAANPATDDEIDGLRIQLLKLREKNEDAAMWLQIPGTSIDVPVMYRPDETNANNYYLHRNLDGETTFAGTPFADYRSQLGNGTIKGLGRSTVIYANNTLGTFDGNPMNDLQKFWEKEFGEKTKEVYLAIPGQAMRGKIVAVSPTTTDVPYNNPKMPDEELDAVIAQFIEDSIYDYGVTVTRQDKLVMISTPYNIPGTTTPGLDRLVVLVKLEPVASSYIVV